MNGGERSRFMEQERREQREDFDALLQSSRDYQSAFD